jgi:hypothetical protein
MQKKKHDELTQEEISNMFENIIHYNIGTTAEPIHVLLNNLREFSEPKPEPK